MITWLKDKFTTYEIEVVPPRLAPEIGSISRSDSPHYPDRKVIAVKPFQTIHYLVEHYDGTRNWRDTIPLTSTILKKQIYTGYYVLYEDISMHTGQRQWSKF